MSDGRKQILSPFTACKKRKAWNKNGQKYMLEERRQNLSEADRGSDCNEEQWLEEFSDDKVHFIMVVKVMTVIMMLRIIMKIMSRSSYQRIFPTIAIKNVYQFSYNKETFPCCLSCSSFMMF